MASFSSWTPVSAPERPHRASQPMEVSGCFHQRAPSNHPPVDVENPILPEEIANGKLGMKASDSSLSETTSDDEEIPASQWPLSPEQRKPLLPPDSSMGNNSRPSTAGERAGGPPNFSDEAGRSRQRRSDSSVVSTSPTNRLQAKREAPSVQIQRTDRTDSNPTRVRTPIAFAD